MSGHSKWASIKRQKAITDGKKSGIFTKLSKNITIAARRGKDPAMNFALRTAIESAKMASMPKANIEKAILKGAGELPGQQQLEEIIYEGYGPNGVALLINVVTDNKNRVSSFLKSTLTKYGGSLASPNAVAYLFKQKGIIHLEENSDELQLKAIEAGACDVAEEEKGLTIYTEPASFIKIKELFPQAVYADIEMVSETSVVLDEAASEKLNLLITELDNNDDVSKVYSNAKN